MIPAENVSTPMMLAVAPCAGLQSRARDITFTFASTVPPVKSFVPTEAWADDAFAFISPMDHQVTRLTPSEFRNTATGLFAIALGLNPTQPALLAEALSRPIPRLSSPK